MQASNVRDIFRHVEKRAATRFELGIWDFDKESRQCH
jgi:hypothetical protein